MTPALLSRFRSPRGSYLLSRFVRGILGNPLGLIGAGIIGMVIITAVLAPVIAPYDPVLVDLDVKLSAPALDHLMGTDQSGRDILSRVIWGSRPSLEVGILSVLIGMAGGICLGLLAGYYSGTVFEQLIMRSIDGLFSIPMLVWAIAVVGIVGVGPIAIGPLIFPNESKVILLV